MPNAPENVCKLGQTGSDRSTVKVALWTHFGNQRGCPEMAARRGQAPAGTDRVGCYGSSLAASEDILLDDRVNAPITVNHLGDAEVNANRN